ncbi:hypothetical protein [Streptomyces sp. NPDC018031]
MDFLRSRALFAFRVLRAGVFWVLCVAVPVLVVWGFWYADPYR